MLKTPWESKCFRAAEMKDQRGHAPGVQFIIGMVILMTVVSLLAIRLIDGMVQIDGDIGILLLFLVLLNSMLALAGWWFYQKRLMKKAI